MQYKVVDYLINMENDGFRVTIDAAELNPNGNEFKVWNRDYTLHFVGTIGPKALGEWIKCQETAKKKK